MRWLVIAAARDAFAHVVALVGRQHHARSGVLAIAILDRYALTFRSAAAARVVERTNAGAVAIGLLPNGTIGVVAMGGSGWRAHTVGSLQIIPVDAATITGARHWVADAAAAILGIQQVCVGPRSRHHRGDIDHRAIGARCAGYDRAIEDGHVERQQARAVARANRRVDLCAKRTLRLRSNGIAIAARLRGSRW